MDSPFVKQPLNIFSKLSLRVHATNSRTCKLFRLRDIPLGHEERNIMWFRDADYQDRILTFQHALNDRGIACMAELPVSPYGARRSSGAARVQGQFQINAVPFVYPRCFADPDDALRCGPQRYCRVRRYHLSTPLDTL